MELARYAADLQRARAFYVDILRTGVLLATPRLLALDVHGESVLLIFKRGATQTPLETDGGLLPAHGGDGVQHLAFAIAASDLRVWTEHLERAGIAIESRVRWPRGGESIYVRDPDGHSIELMTPGLWATY